MSARVIPVREAELIAGEYGLTVPQLLTEEEVLRRQVLWRVLATGQELFAEVEGDAERVVEREVEGVGVLRYVPYEGGRSMRMELEGRRVMSDFFVALNRDDALCSMLETEYGGGQGGGRALLYMRGMMDGILLRRAQGELLQKGREVVQSCLVDSASIAGWTGRAAEGMGYVRSGVTPEGKPLYVREYVLGECL